MRGTGKWGNLSTPWDLKVAGVDLNGSVDVYESTNNAATVTLTADSFTDKRQYLHASDNCWNAAVAVPKQLMYLRLVCGIPFPSY
jgi:hypothetical protein